MKKYLKSILSVFLVAVFLCNLATPTMASWSEYTSWSGWSDWIDGDLSENDYRQVERRTVEASANYKTVYHYFRYAKQYYDGNGYYKYTTSCPNYYTYDFDEGTADVRYVGTEGGYNKYQWWYNNQYDSIYGCNPLTTQEVVSYNYKNQYRYRTRSLIYYYTVSYDANGGSGAPSSQTKQGGVGLTLSSTVPKKSFTVTYNANGGSVSSSSKKVDCSFGGWQGNGATYSAGGWYSSDSDVSMKAKWTNPSVGSLLTPTRTGYTFDGWYTAASGGTQITSSSTISSNTTIYAHWKENSYTVSHAHWLKGFNNNEGNNIEKNCLRIDVTTRNFDYEEGLTVSESEKITSPNGFRATNQYVLCNYNGENIVSDFDVKKSNISENINTEFYYEPITYTLHYDLNGGEMPEGVQNPSNYNVLYGADFETPVRENYIFDGWMIDGEIVDGINSSTLPQEYCITDQGTSGDFYSWANNRSTGNKEVVAQWTLNAYDVTYYANGGSKPPMATKKIHNENLIVNETGPSIPKKYVISYDANGGNVLESNKDVYCLFDKWNTRIDGSGTIFEKNELYTENAPLILYAQWRNTAVGQLSTPTKEGHTFLGWFTGRVDGEQISAESVISEDIVVYAHWEANSYNVSFNANGGTSYEKTMEVTYGSTFGDLPNASRVGYFFQGWFTSPTEGKQVYDTSIVSVTEPITLYAHWTPKDVVSVAVDLDRTKTVYYIGEDFDANTIVLIATFEDGEVGTITDGFTCSSPLINKISKKRVSVEYLDFSIYYTIDIRNSSLQSISIKTLPEKMSYSIGDTVDTTGMVLTATYLNGNTQDITSGYDIEYNFDLSGTKTVTISYSENEVTKTTSYNVTVNALPLIYSNEVAGYCGDTISVPICISQNSGIMGLGLNIEYDENVFMPVSVEKNPLIQGALNDDIPTTNNNSFNVFWTGSSNMTEDGMLFTIDFLVLENAYGEHEISVSYSSDDTFNEAWEEVKLNCQNVNVSILSGDGSDAKIFANNVSVKSGGTITLPIKIMNGEGFTDTIVSLSYDKDVFTPISIFDGICSVNDSNLSTANGKLDVELSEMLGSASDGTLFYVTFNLNYCDTGNYIVEISNSASIKCEDAIVNVTAGDAQIYGATISRETDGMIKVPVCIKGNQGIMGFRLNFTYDATALTPISVSAGSGLTSGNLEDSICDTTLGSFSVVWTNTDDLIQDGEILLLMFSSNSEDTLPTVINIDFEQADTYNSNWEDVAFACESISIDKTEKIVYGDVTGDDIISGKDLVRLRKYLLNYDEETGTSDVEISLGADVTGDGIVNGKDLVRLRKYLLNYDEATGTSTVVLGP